MPKVFPITSSVIIVGLCLAVALEARSIVDLTHRLEAAEQRAAENAKRAKTDQEELAQTREHNDALRSESEALRSRLAGGETAGPEAKDAAKAKSPLAGNFGEALKKMMSDPSMKKAIRQQQSMAMRNLYADLIKQLGLSPDAADNLMEMLADRQMAMTEKGMALLNGKADGKQAEEAAGASADYDNKLSALLGADGYSQFQSYEKTLGDRAMMQQYDQYFASNGQKLDDSQSAALLQIMVDERAKSPPSPFDTSKQNSAEQIQALQSDQALHDFFASQGDLNLRVYNRASAILTPDQLTAFQKIQQQMTDMQQAGIKMGQAMMK